MDSARILLRLPQMGETWFFVHQDTTVGQLKQNVKAEDNQIEKIDIKSHKGSINDDI